MLNPSIEQQNILKTVRTKNIIIQAIAGAGKTTTILHIANQFKRKKVLLLTYNSKLRKETCDRIEKFELKNIDCHTYHSYFHKYDNSVINDIMMQKYLDKTKKLPVTKYNIVIIDEAQDMIPLYYRAIRCLLSSNKCDYKICLLGDKKQNIYDYNNADYRFITLGHNLFNVNKYEWSKLRLTVTYRLTCQMTGFINNVVLHKNKLIGVRQGPIVNYILLNTFNVSNFITKILDPLVTKYGCSNIFILAPSVKSNLPIQILANQISLIRDYPIYIPNNCDTIASDDILRDKLIFSSFHQSKGRERKCVIVFNFDDSYFTFFDKNNTNKQECPNVLYVALSRATEKLVILHDYKYGFMPFININQLKVCSRINVLHEDKFTVYDYYKQTEIIDLKDRMEELETSVINSSKIKDNNKKDLTVTSLIQHISSDTMFHVSKYIKPMLIEKENNIINLQDKVITNYNMKEIHEDVSSINGIFVPLYFEYIKLNKSTYIDQLNKPYTTNNKVLLLDFVGNTVCYSVLLDDNDNILKAIPHKLHDRRKTKLELVGDYKGKCNVVYCYKSYFHYLYKWNSKKLDYLDIYNKYTDGIKLDKEELLKVSNIYDVYNSNYVYKLIQIQNYDWIDDIKLERCISRISEIIKDNNFVFEQPVTMTIEDYTVNGMIDCVYGNSVYEFKCTNGLSDEHFLQIMLYKLLHNSDCRFYIFNILSGCLYEIVNNIEELDMLAKTIIKNKFIIKQNIDDNNFLENCKTLICDNR